MPQIIPIKDLKNTSEIFEGQVESGQVKDARAALRETRAKYGL